MRLIRIPPVLLGWPRRAAAALCFLLAAVTALAPSRGRTSTIAPRPQLPPGFVTTTVAVYADGLAFVHVGDRIDLVASTTTNGAASASDAPPSVVAHGVEVLAVRPQHDAATDVAVSQVLLAAPRDVAVRIAAHQGVQALAAISAGP